MRTGHKKLRRHFWENPAFGPISCKYSVSETDGLHSHSQHPLPQNAFNISHFFAIHIRLTPETGQIGIIRLFVSDQTHQIRYFIIIWNDVVRLNTGNMWIYKCLLNIFV